MQLDFEDIIKKTADFVRRTLEGTEAGHDWFHIERVYHTALHINANEGGDVFIISLAALLHDIADSKFNDGDEELGPEIAGKFLQGLDVPAEIIVQVQLIIKNLSYKVSLGETNFSCREMDVVQDADRLDAIGAVGIARAFTYGGYKNRAMYDPSIPPAPEQSKNAYKNSTAPTINHFYEKLLLLKDLMKTSTGRNMAEQRHQFMLLYLNQFYAEWSGKQ